ncbi:hypothetical protein [Pseudoalteromonas sp. MMG012]|uniref:hypothetical protein n=1 Tax=Pseudoalteromonas sp. MMG012 TaxID=2822686 RepID=UPI001B3A0BE6|nr:hypothetical protein [Pseudoalteromonas sp. MMG012]MBQ4852853.1 hypothetical protein [Pseudoalteromonas sp. MMG012]
MRYGYYSKTPIKIVFAAVVTVLSGCTSMQKSHNDFFEYQKGDFVLINGNYEFSVDPFQTKLELQSCLLTRTHKHHETTQATVTSKSSLLASSVINEIKHFNDDAVITRAKLEYQYLSSSFITSVPLPVTIFAVKEIPINTSFSDITGDASNNSGYLNIGNGTTSESYIYELSTAVSSFSSKTKSYVFGELPSVQIRFKVTSYQLNQGLIFSGNRIGRFTVDSNTIATTKLASDLIGLIAADTFYGSNCLDSTLRTGSLQSTARKLMKKARSNNFPLTNESKEGTLCIKEDFRNLTEPFFVNISLFNTSRPIAELIAPNGCSVDDVFKVARLKILPSGKLCFQAFVKKDLDAINAMRGAFYKAYAAPATHWLVNAYDINDVPLGCSTFQSSELYFNSSVNEEAK